MVNEEDVGIGVDKVRMSIVWLFNGGWSDVWFGRRGVSKPRMLLENITWLSSEVGRSGRKGLGHVCGKMGR